jgi:single-stranded-DNA-specific exonuclease
MVFGDYDVDGLTGLALLKTHLSEMGLDVRHCLPHRLRDGYGLTKDIAATASSQKVKLLITVDCGISNASQIEQLRRNNIDVIITDHHEPSGASLPEASAIINPKIKKSGYPFRDLSGAGVAFKLCQAFSQAALTEDLDLVSLGTIADSVPLTGENRVIAKEGLERLPRTPRQGLRVLMESAGIQNKKFNSTFVSFILGPRINACGRLDSAETSLRLLLSRDKFEAEELARVIESRNRLRQKIENQILEEAQELIDREVNFKKQKVIVIAKEDWHQGVLGIVAAKIAERFYRPAIVISLNENLCRGSARSIKNFHLFDALVECRELLNAFGGHAHAAGLVITRDGIDDFRRSINRLAQEKLSLEDLLPSLEVDMELKFADLNAALAGELGKLQPFGAGNPEPLFFSRNLKLKSQPQTLSRQTLKFWATDGYLTLEAIGFGMSHLKDSLLQAGVFDLVYTPKIDDWDGDSSLILEIKDIFFR